MEAKTPKLTVTKYKSCRGDEGDCFSCDLLVDGKTVAHVEYDGRGGNFRYDWRPDGSEYFREPGPVGTALLAWVATLPEEDCCGMMLKPDLDLKVSEVIDNMLEEKRLRKLCKTKTVVRKPDGKIVTWAVPFSPAFKAKILAGNIIPAGSVFLNESLAA